MPKHWSPTGCQIWVWIKKKTNPYYKQCPRIPAVAKDSVLLCAKHKHLKVVDGRAVDES